MDVDIKHARPIHHHIDKIYRLTGIVNINHQVSKAINNDKPIVFPSVECILYGSQANGWCKLSKPYENKVFTVFVIWQPRQTQNTLHNLMAMKAALLCIKIEHLTLSFW